MENKSVKVSRKGQFTWNLWYCGGFYTVTERQHNFHVSGIGALTLGQFDTKFPGARTEMSHLRGW